MEKFEPITVTTDDAMKLFGRGRNNIVTDAKNANAFFKMGRKNMIFVDRLRKYYESMIVYK